MRLGYALLGLVLLLGLAAPGAPAQALAPAGTALSLGAPAASADSTTPLRVVLTGADGVAVAGAAVTVERRSGGAWSPLGVVTTDAGGAAVLPVTLARVAGDNVFRASYAGDADHAPASSPEVRVALQPRTSVLEVNGPAAVRDGRRVPIKVAWTTGGGSPVPGPVEVSRRTESGEWAVLRTVVTDARGRAVFRVRPEEDTRWRASAAALDWVAAATSAVHRVRVTPPGTPVRLPAGAPRPRVQVPPQPRAVGAGANVVVTPVPDAVWDRMTGVSWHAGCPVGRAGLRLVRVNYWDYDGYRRRGELVAATGAAGQMAGALAELYARGYPIRSLHLVDRFGRSARLGGGNDYASMAAGNSSAFNCRDVVNRPGVTSPHAYGRALDLNTWENPYRSATGLVPNTWWQARSHPRVAWRSRSHPVVRILARHGLRWTYGLGDTQHFDAASGNGRVVAVPGCGSVVCE